MKQITSKRRGRWKAAAWIVLAVVLALLVKFILHLVLPRNFAGSGEKLPLPGFSPPFETQYYCSQQRPKGIVILGTGDGGWSYWEERTAKHLAGKGFAVGGWDCRKFADTRQYDLAVLSAGFRSAVNEVSKRSGADPSAPVWLGGWSTGAEQAIAVAASPDRPPNVCGLLVIAPGTHGRFGITESDLLGIDPSGPDTFALADIAPGITGMKVVQLAAGLDLLDDVDWIQNVKVPHRLMELPGKLHDMGGADDEFLEKLDEAIAWTQQNHP